MAVEHEILNQTDLIFLNGRIDARSAPGVNEEIGKILDAGKNKMLINFKGLEYISSAGLRVLITVAKKTKALGKDLVLCSLDEKIYEVFDISGFTAIFKIFETQEDALAALEA
ncbi:MAG: STAS domain-containing protein [Desulfobacteraceae bacterium]|nr:STAS domain-containing protein [Desulfobacteraceae bacterium]